MNHSCPHPMSDSLCSYCTESKLKAIKLLTHFNFISVDLSQSWLECWKKDETLKEETLIPFMSHKTFAWNFLWITRLPHQRLIRIRIHSYPRLHQIGRIFPWKCFPKSRWLNKQSRISETQSSRKICLKIKSTMTRSSFLIAQRNLWWFENIKCSHRQNISNPLGYK